MHRLYVGTRDRRRCDRSWRRSRSQLQPRRLWRAPRGARGSRRGGDAV